MDDFLVEPSGAAWLGGDGSALSSSVWNNHTSSSSPLATNLLLGAAAAAAQMVTPSSMLAFNTQSTMSTMLMDSPTMSSAPNVSTSISETTFIIVSRVVPVFFGFIGITGLLGNALVVLVVLSNPGMRSTTNLLIINLAMADLLFVVFCVPFTGSDYVLDEWPYGDIWCRVVQYLIVVTAHASIYTLVLMSLDRYLAVVHPIASMVIRTEAYTMRAILVLWFLILTTAIPVLYVHGENVSQEYFWLKSYAEISQIRLSIIFVEIIFPGGIMWISGN